MIDPDDVTQRALKSVKWTVLIEVLSRTIQPIVYIILAKLLSPNDFGVVGIAIIVINFSQMFWDAGLSKALIQIDGNLDDAANIVFWSNLVLSLTIYAIVFLTAPLQAAFFNSPASMWVIRGMGLQIILQGLTSVQQALMIRDLGFKQLFSIRIVTALIPPLFSLPMAYFKFGPWALVAGTFAGAVVNLILLWARSPWKPRLYYDLVVAKRLIKFGAWVIGESLINWFMTWGDNLIVGHFLGVEALGVYQMGWNIVISIFGFTLNPFLPIVYPTFSRLQNNLSEIKIAFYRVNKILITLAAPIGVGLLLVGDEINKTFFSSKWENLGLVIGIIGLMQGIAWFVSINPDIYRAMGRPDLNMKLGLIMAAYYLPAFLVAATFGLKIFVITRLLVCVIGIPFHVFLCKKVLNVSYGYIWELGNKVFLASLLMIGGVLSMKYTISIIWIGIPNIIMLTVMIILGATIYSIALWAFDKPLIMEGLRLFRKAIN